MEGISILAIDLAKGSFQVCGVDAGGTILFNRAVSRPKLRQVLADQKACIVAMEACATGHHWAGLRSRMGMRFA